MLVQLNEATKKYGDIPTLEKVTLKIVEGQKIGMIGGNGSGKTTILKVITGEEGLFEGTVSRKKDLRIGYVQQESPDTKELVADYILASFTEIQRIKQAMNDLTLKMSIPEADIAPLMQKYARLVEQFEQLDGYSLENRLTTTLKGLGLKEIENRQLNQLSGGEKVLVEIAKVLLSEVDLYLLDEPTNHLDTHGIEWLESFLRHSPAACVIISHDRCFLDNVVTSILEVEDGEVITYPGNYTNYVELKKARIALLEKDYALQQKEIKKLKASIRRYRQWGNESDNEKFFKRAKHLEKRLENIQRIKKPSAPKKKLLNNSRKDFQRSGKEVASFHQVSKFYGSNLLFEAADFTIFWQEKLAVLGNNGSGKSTFIKLLLGTEKPTTGEIKIGSGVKIGYLSQHISFSSKQQRVLDYFKECVGEEQKARNILAAAGFYQEDVSKRLMDLSGGEKVRIVLAKMFQQKINFLILDEPTNHLDIETREEIEKRLADFSGTVLVVSHDRYFVSKLFDSFIEIREKRLYRGHDNSV